MQHPARPISPLSYVGLFAALALAGCASSTGHLQAAPDQFADQVWPILRANCLGCHGAFYDQGGLRLDEKERIERGSKNGPVIDPGSATTSELIRRLSLPEDDPDRMPQKAKRLAPEEIEAIAAWIDSGADFGSWKDAGSAGPED